MANEKKVYWFYKCSVCENKRDSRGCYSFLEYDKRGDNKPDGCLFGGSGGYNWKRLRKPPREVMG